MCAHAHVRCMCFCMLTGIEGFNFEFDRGCVYVYTFNSSPYSHIHFLQSVSACLVSTLSLPLCLYRLWLSSSAQLADKIRPCSACPVFPQYHILSLFSSPPLSKANECVCMSVCMCLWMCACVCVCANVCVRGCVRLYHIIGLDIKASYLQRVSQGFSGNLERTWYRCISQIISPLGYTGLKGKRSRGHESYA